MAEISIESVKASLSLSDTDIEPLAEDASTRRYYRIKAHNRETCVLMVDDGSHQSNLTRTEWLQIRSFLEIQNIRVPRLIANHCEFSSLIIEDFGNTTLQQSFKENPKAGIKLYNKTIPILVRYLSLEGNSELWTQRGFDEAKLYNELLFLYEHFLNPEKIIHASELPTFQTEAKHLARYLSKFSRFFTHRDFHSRNLMVIDGNLGVIDFQDARLGPPAYDLVSLFFDSYAPLKQMTRLEFVRKAIREVAKFRPDTAQIIDETWQATLLQRQLKAIGSFGYLTKEGKGNYLINLKPAVRTLIDNCGQLEWNFLCTELIGRLSEYQQ